MTTTMRVLLFAAVIFAVGSTAYSQDVALAGRSSIEMSLGFWGGASASSSTSIVGIRTHAGTDGFSGGLAYAYWLREGISLTLSGGLRSASASSTLNTLGETDQASAVIPILLGLRFYLPQPEPGDNIRPYVSLAVGPYFGAEASSTILQRQSHVETAIGARPGVGIDFFLGNHFKLGADVGYHVMENFNSEVGGRRSYNGGEFCFVLGFIF